MAWSNVCDRIAHDALRRFGNIIYLTQTHNAPCLYFMPLAEERVEMVFWIKKLSDREREVSILVAREFTNKQIGENLDISELTVKTHLRNVYSKTGVHDKAQLVSRILKSETDFWNVEYHKLMRRLHQAQDDKNKK